MRTILLAFLATLALYSLGVGQLLTTESKLEQVKIIPVNIFTQLKSLKISNREEQFELVRCESDQSQWCFIDDQNEPLLQSMVQELLEGLEKLQAISLSPSQAPDNWRRSFGFEPAMQSVLLHSGEDTSFRVVVGKQNASLDAQYLLVNDQHLFLVPKEYVLPIDAIHSVSLRDPQIFRAFPRNPQSILLLKGGVSFRMEHDGSEWRDSNGSLLDQIVIQQFLSDLSSLRAAGFVLGSQIPQNSPLQQIYIKGSDGSASIMLLQDGEGNTQVGAYSVLRSGERPAPFVVSRSVARRVFLAPEVFHNAQ